MVLTRFTVRCHQNQVLGVVGDTDIVALALAINVLVILAPPCAATGPTWEDGAATPNVVEKFDCGYSTASSPKYEARNVKTTVSQLYADGSLNRLTKCEPVEGWRRRAELDAVTPVRTHINGLWRMHLRCDQWYAEGRGVKGVTRQGMAPYEKLHEGLLELHGWISAWDRWR